MSSLDFSNLLTGLVEEHETPEGAKLRDIPIDEIYEDPSNPRTSFDKDQLKEMAASVKAHGVLQPITVRPKDDRGYMIRFGARRFRAAKIAGIATVRAIVSTSDADEADILAAQVIENHHRAGLSTQEMIQAVSRLLTGGLSQGAAAEKLGISREQVNMYAGLRDLPPVLDALTPTLGVRALYELHGAWRRDPARTEALIAERGEAITVAEARAFAAELKAGQQGKATTIAQPAPASEVEGEGVLYIQQSQTNQDRAGEAQEGVLYVQQPEEGSLTPPPRRAVIVGFDVKVGRRNGRLLLDAGPDRETVMIEFEGGVVEPAPVSSVRLLGVRSH
ncbi:ParB/RepB/Spo0J family partition protein [Phenylobacterium sp. LjRoot225]|uniref:ParB/RepB/Spo0J family partition protein n=1 Tax=Phenylobacterium sp. LjRoot225 TaxID=3342285 RepID=UPI003ED029AD